MGCSKKVCSKVGAIVSLFVVIVIGVVCFAVVPIIIEDSVIENTILDDPSSDQYERFEVLPFALNFSVRFFNVENPEQVMDGTEQPNLRELGKLVYSEVLKKNNLVLQDDNLLRYDWERVFEYNAEFSEIEESAKVNIINVPLVVVYQIFEKMSLQLGFLGRLLTLVIESGCPNAFDMPPNTVFREASVGEYAMNGYRFCQKARVKDFTAKLLCSILRSVEVSETLTQDSDGTMVFSFFAFKRGVLKGAFHVESGINDINELGQIKKWESEKQAEGFWNKEGNCNELRGTDTTIYAPFNDKATVFTVFNTDVCRKITLSYNKDIEYDDVPGYQSDIEMKNLDWSLEENSCYCILKARTLHGKKECLPNGFMDMSNCVGAPLILSYPHFLWGDKEYADTVTGMEPDEDKHKIFIKMEPNTGTPLEGHKRVQFNIILRSYTDGTVQVTKNVKSAMMPIFWIDESAEVPDHLVQIIKDQYLNPVGIVTIATWSLIGVSGAALVGFLSFYLCVRC